MTGKNENAYRLGRKLEHCADRLVNFLQGEMQTTVREAEDRAHIATTSDHPFLGCNPCQASEPDLGPVPPPRTGTIVPD